jgi:GNAT superfamily N-acetyltransferase
MHLTVSRIHPSDFDAIVPAQFAAFEPIDLAAAFFGRPSPANFAIAKKKNLDSFHNDPADLWMKVTDEDEEIEVDIINEDYVEGSGDNNSFSKGKKIVKRIVSASNWKIYPTFVEGHEAKQAAGPLKAATNDEVKASGEAEKKADGSEITWLSTPAERADAHSILEDFMARRRRACREGHILLAVLFVHPEYQRRGAGSMMVQWGADLADQLMLPAWVEASPFGHGLYARYGFEDVDHVKVVTKTMAGEYTPMRRPLKVKGFSGKELAKF